MHNKGREDTVGPPPKREREREMTDEGDLKGKMQRMHNKTLRDAGKADICDVRKPLDLADDSSGSAHDITERRCRRLAAVFVQYFMFRTPETVGRDKWVFYLFFSKDGVREDLVQADKHNLLRLLYTHFEPSPEVTHKNIADALAMLPKFKDLFDPIPVAHAIVPKVPIVTSTGEIPRSPGVYDGVFCGYRAMDLSKLRTVNDLVNGDGYPDEVVASARTSFAIAVLLPSLLNYIPGVVPMCTQEMLKAMTDTLGLNHVQLTLPVKHQKSEFVRDLPSTVAVNTAGAGEDVSMQKELTNQIKKLTHYGLPMFATGRKFSPDFAHTWVPDVRLTVSARMEIPHIIYKILTECKDLMPPVDESSGSAVPVTRALDVLIRSMGLGSAEDAVSNWNQPWKIPKPRYEAWMSMTATATTTAPTKKRKAGDDGGDNDEADEGDEAVVEEEKKPEAKSEAKSEKSSKKSKGEKKQDPKKEKEEVDEDASEPPKQAKKKAKTDSASSETPAAAMDRLFGAKKVIQAHAKETDAKADKELKEYEEAVQGEAEGLKEKKRQEVKAKKEKAAKAREREARRLEKEHQKLAEEAKNDPSSEDRVSEKSDREDVGDGSDNSDDGDGDEVDEMEQFKLFQQMLKAKAKKKKQQKQKEASSASKKGKSKATISKKSKPTTKKHDADSSSDSDNDSMDES